MEKISKVISTILFTQFSHYMYVPNLLQTCTMKSL